MPRSRDINVAFLQQCVAVVEIFRQFGCLLEEEELPAGPFTRPPVRASPVPDAEMVECDDVTNASCRHG